MKKMDTMQMELMQKEGINGAGKKLETKTLALSAIMIAVGFVLHSVFRRCSLGSSPIFCWPVFLWQ